jgi:HD-GYP domain-containing protein (c-di-GMP phosphodiesterase class II)
MAVVDIYDALVTDRPYRKGMPLEKAIGILKQDADNKKLDPVVVNYLIEFVEEEQPIDTAPNQD